MSEREDDFLGRWSRRKVEARGGGLKKKPEAEDAPDALVHKPGRMRTEPLLTKTEDLAVAEDAQPGDELLVQEASLREDLGEDQVPAPLDEEETPDGDDSDTETSANTEPEDFDKIDFEKLNYDSDYTKFMKSNVPESVRKRALRQLWGSNPILANVDGLNDYDDDFTDAALAVKGLLKTSYKVGSGYLTPEELDASYSEEARKAGVEPEEETETEAEDKIASDDETEDGAEDTGGEVAESTASDDEPSEISEDNVHQTDVSDNTAQFEGDDADPVEDNSGKADDTA